MQRAKVISEGNDKSLVSCCVEKMCEAAIRGMNDLEGKLNVKITTALKADSGCMKEMREFFEACAYWNAERALKDSIVELLPKGQMPKPGTEINKLIGQPFELDFGGIISVVSVLFC